MGEHDSQTVADAFNRLAARENWGSICDPDLAFLCGAHSALANLWREKAGLFGIPARREFTARCLKSFLKDVAIYERVNPLGASSRYRVRLMGTSFAAVMGDLTGKHLDEAVPERFLARWTAALDAALDAAAPLRFLARSDTVDKSFLIAEYFEAPLLDDNGRRTLVLASSRFGVECTSPNPGRAGGQVAA